MDSRCVVVCPECGELGSVSPWQREIKTPGMAREINRSLDYHLAMGGSEPDDDYYYCDRCHGSGKVGPVNAHGLEPGPGR